MDLHRPATSSYPDLKFLIRANWSLTVGTRDRYAAIMTRATPFATGSAILSALLALTLNSPAQPPSTSPPPTRDRTPPTLTLTTPGVGLVSKETEIIFVGNVTDDRKIDRVMYRPDGGEWRKATLNASGTSATSAVFAFTAKLRPKYRVTRFYIRAYDASGNESDTIARPVRQK